MRTPYTTIRDDPCGGSERLRVLLYVFICININKVHI